MGNGHHHQHSARETNEVARAGGASGAGTASGAGEASGAGGASEGGTASAIHDHAIHAHGGGENGEAGMAELLDLDAEVLHAYLSEVTGWVCELAAGLLLADP